MRMIVGLGNPGKEYTGTRHNVGFTVIDTLAEALDIKVKQRKFGARFGEGELDDDKLILLKPGQFMNRSGQVVATAVGFYKLPIENLLVVTDDMALDVGRIRLRAKGSAGGHNGLNDIVQKLGTEEFARLRIGIGSAGQQEAYDYVLSRFDEQETALMEAAVARARDAVLCWLRQGIEAAMNEYNRADEQMS